MHNNRSEKRIAVSCERKKEYGINESLNEDTNTTELKIVCGPYGKEFDTQKDIISTWAQKVKELSEVK